MNNKASISTTKITAFLYDLDTYGVNLDEVIRCSGVDPFLLSSPDHRLSGAEVCQIAEAALKLTSDEDFGLHQGERLSRGFSNILGYILMNCTTLRDCWTYYGKYEAIIDSTGSSELIMEEDNAIICLDTTDQTMKYQRQYTDFKLTGLISYIRLLTGRKIRLQEVHFNYPKPDNISEHQRIFQCNLCFGKATNAIVFSNNQFDISVIEPNRELLLLLEREAQVMLEAYQSTGTYTNKVTEVVMKEIKKGILPSIEYTAKMLSVSVRNLQLNLQREETSYTKLLISIRKRMAEKYLQDKTISIDEIAYVLGYSETSAFHRAFRKWTDQTPVQYRRLS